MLSLVTSLSLSLSLFIFLSIHLSVCHSITLFSSLSRSFLPWLLTYDIEFRAGGDVRESEHDQANAHERRAKEIGCCVLLALDQHPAHLCEEEKIKMHVKSEKQKREKKRRRKR